MIEIVIAIVVAGLITAGVTATIFQLLRGNAMGVKQMTALRQVQQAGHWISEDALQASCVYTLNPDGTFPLVLSWTSFETDEQHEVNYTLEDQEIWREHLINGGTAESTYIASHITAISLQNDSSRYQLTVTAQVSGWYPSSETRIYEIEPRLETGVCP